MNSDLQNLQKIFNNRIFRIPDYQRGFAWGDDQLTDFWSDLQRMDSDRIHYCGQITLERARESAWRLWDGDAWLVDDAGYEPYFVVDGQQRLTTSIILIQCLLENLQQETIIAGRPVSELRERYLAKGNGVLKSCLFGYAKDNPSHEFFRTQILAVPSNDYNGTRTVYTANLAGARDYFRRQLATITETQAREKLLKSLVQRFQFSLYELTDDIDVFVAFETMNNRGKPLSRLELLKNRLIYLSTFAIGSDAERQKVRGNINSVWRTVYEELGKHPTQSLADDEFLRAHWIVFFGYDKDEADPLTKFLLGTYFTATRVDTGELTLDAIQKYGDSLQATAKIWQRLHFPEDSEQALGVQVAQSLIRLKRLGFGVLRPLLLAVLSRDGQPDAILPVLHQAERFLVLVRSFAHTRSHVGEPDSYRLAYDIYQGKRAISDVAVSLSERVARHFSVAAFKTVVDELFADSDGNGFYDLSTLKFILFEYEEKLRIKAKAAAPKISWEGFRGARNSVEHVYPQTPEADKWPLFEPFHHDQRRYLTHSLGNLVAVSVAKNSSLSRRSFKEKKKGTDKVPGFNQGSFSELSIALNDDWTPINIRDRGVELLNFIEEKWQVSFGSTEEKHAMLKMEFLANHGTPEKGIPVT